MKKYLSILSDIQKLLRPRQWIKNGFVLAPLLFALEINNPDAWRNAVFAVAAFICVSGATYILNDIRDRDSDRKHPKKKLRPIAAGRIDIRTALQAATFLITAGIGFAALLPAACIGILLFYFMMNLAYSFHLKRVAILDVLVIAAGFVLRVLMGGMAIDVLISPWILIATFMLALFLCFGKRRRELKEQGDELRQSLVYYNEAFLDKLITLSCTSAFLTYAIYSVEMANRTGRNALVFTVVFVAFGLFRYLQHIYVDKGGEEPEQILYRDPMFLGNLLLWLAATLWALR